MCARLHVSDTDSWMILGLLQLDKWIPEILIGPFSERQLAVTWLSCDRLESGVFLARPQSHAFGTSSGTFHVCGVAFWSSLFEGVCGRL